MISVILSLIYYTDLCLNMQYNIKCSDNLSNFTNTIILF